MSAAINWSRPARSNCKINVSPQSTPTPVNRHVAPSTESSIGSIKRRPPKHPCTTRTPWSSLVVIRSHPYTHPSQSCSLFLPLMEHFDQRRSFLFRDHIQQFNDLLDICQSLSQLLFQFRNPP